MALSIRSSSSTRPERVSNDNYDLIIIIDVVGHALSPVSSGLSCAPSFLIRWRRKWDSSAGARKRSEQIGYGTIQVSRKIRERFRHVTRSEERHDSESVPNASAGEEGFDRGEGGETVSRSVRRKREVPNRTECGSGLGDGEPSPRGTCRTKSDSTPTHSLRILSSTRISLRTCLTTNRHIRVSGSII